MQSFLNWSFRLYRLFGIEVRIHWLFPVIAALEILQWSKEEGRADYGAYLMLSLFLSTLIHEYGHCAAARIVGAGADQILLWPLGGLAMVGHSPTNRGEVFVALAGPITGFLACAVCLGVSGVLGEPITWNTFNPFGGKEAWGHSLVQDILKLNLIVNAVNLLTPAFPLDGGRILTGLLVPLLGYARALLTTTLVGIIFGIGLMGSGMYFRAWHPTIFGIWVAVSCVIARMQLKAGAMPEYAYAESFDYRPERPHRPGFFARWRMKREARRRARMAQEERRIREQVDNILDKVKREGMEALTPRERAALNEASKFFRDNEG
jgi:Zn-dependent protease